MNTINMLRFQVIGVVDLTRVCTSRLAPDFLWLTALPSFSTCPLSCQDLKLQITVNDTCNRHRRYGGLTSGYRKKNLQRNMQIKVKYKVKINKMRIAILFTRFKILHKQNLKELVIYQCFERKFFWGGQVKFRAKQLNIHSLKILFKLKIKIGSIVISLAPRLTIFKRYALGLQKKGE